MLFGYDCKSGPLAESELIMASYLEKLAVHDPHFATVCLNNSRAGEKVCEFIVSLPDDALGRMIVLAPTSDFLEPFVLHSLDCPACTNKIAYACAGYVGQRLGLAWPSEEMDKLHERIAQILRKSPLPTGRMGGPRRFVTS